MKKVASVLLVFVMLFSFTACSDSGLDLLQYFGERYHYVKPNFGTLTARGSLTGEDIEGATSNGGEESDGSDDVSGNTENSGSESTADGKETTLTAAVEYYVFGGATFYVDKNGSIVGIDLDFSKESEVDLERFNIAGIGANTSLGNASGKLNGDGTAVDSAGYAGAKSFQDVETSATVTLYYDADEIVRRIYAQA